MHFIIKRLFRLIPALFISATCIALIAGPMLTTDTLSNYFSNKETYKFIFNNILFDTKYMLPSVFESLPYTKGVNGSWWTLRHEFYCYRLLLIFGILGIFKNIKVLLIISFLFIYLLLSESTLMVDLFTNQSKSVYHLYLSFILGSLCFIFSHKIKVNLKILLAIACLTYISKDTYLYPFLFTICCFYSCICLSISSLFLKWKIKHDISYGVYIYGFFIQQLLVYFLPTMHYIFNVLLSVVICVFLGILSAIYVEEPSMKLAQRIIIKMKR